MSWKAHVGTRYRRAAVEAATFAGRFGSTFIGNFAMSGLAVSGLLLPDIAAIVANTRPARDAICTDRGPAGAIWPSPCG